MTSCPRRGRRTERCCLRSMRTSSSSGAPSISGVPKLSLTTRFSFRSRTRTFARRGPAGARSNHSVMRCVGTHSENFEAGCSRIPSTSIGYGTEDPALNVRGASHRKNRPLVLARVTRKVGRTLTAANEVRGPSGGGYVVRSAVSRGPGGDGTEHRIGSADLAGPRTSRRHPFIRRCGAVRSDGGGDTGSRDLARPRRAALSSRHRCVLVETGEARSRPGIGGRSAVERERAGVRRTSRRSRLSTRRLLRCARGG